MSGHTDPGDNHACQANVDGVCRWCLVPMRYPPFANPRPDDGHACLGMTGIARCSWCGFDVRDPAPDAPAPRIPGDDLENLAHSLLYEAFLAGARPIAADVPDSVVRRAQAYADANWREAARRMTAVVAPVVVAAVESAVTQMADRTAERIRAFGERQAAVMEAFVVRSEELLGHRVNCEPVIDEREGHR